MNAPNRPKAIFLKYLEQSTPEDRAAVVDRECGSDAELRRQVEALLAAHAASDSFLEKTAAALEGTIDVTAARSLGEEPPGTRIGPYKLLQKLGEGGMGVVFLAEQQEPVRRMIALKIIKQGMDSGQIVARFESERQALALMDHPNIARVLDAGTTEGGRPYFVMELIKGIPITKFCDQEHLTPRERLELFVPVCQAVQHAHQKGIIHRDLKPSNVMIALYDGKPIPKVIDFGVAKATSQKLTERTLFTEVGSMVGTLEYMAPEQAELNNLDIDTRADIYSLGVLMYELLTGSPPFSAKELRSNAFAEMLRIIREVEPPRPSTKLSSSQELPAIAARRKLEPGNLTRQVQGDLDWIVMKCLEKERGRRYETAIGVALDIQRYLTDEPVQAGPPRAGYRLRKFVKRNRGAVTAASVVLLAVAIGMLGTTWGLLEALDQRDRTDQARLKEAEQRDVAVQALAAKSRADSEARQLAEQVADAEKRKAQSVRAHLEFEKSSHFLERGDMPSGMLWLTRALADAPDEETELKQSLRRILGGWSQHLHAPTRLFAHASPITVVAFRPNSDMILTAGRDGLARLWDASTGRAVGISFKHSYVIHSAVFSSDGKLLAMASYDHMVRLWNVDSGEPVGDPIRQADVNCLAFSDDGKSLFTGGIGRAECNRVWSTATGKQSSQLQTDDTVFGAAFLPDGKSLLTAGAKGARRWDAETGNSIGEALLPDRCESISMSLDGKTFLALTLTTPKTGLEAPIVITNGISRLYETATGKPAGEPISYSMRLGKFPNAHIPMSEDGKLLFAPRFRSGASVYEAATGKQIGQLIPDTGLASALRQDGKAVLLTTTTTGPEIAQLWDIASPRRRHIDHRFVFASAFSPDGNSLATSDAGSDEGIRRWDAASGRMIGKPIAARAASALAFSPDGKLLAALGKLEKSTDRETVVIWNLATGTTVGKPIFPGSHSGPLAFSPDSSQILVTATRGIDRMQVRYAVATGNQVEELFMGRFYYSSLLSPRGTHLLVHKPNVDQPATPGTTVQVLDAVTAKPIGKAIQHFVQDVNVSMVFSPDEKMFATLEDPPVMSLRKYISSVRLWETESGRPMSEPAFHDTGFNTLPRTRIAFLPDGKTLVTEGDACVWLWDVPTLKPLGPPLQAGTQMTIAIDPTGRTLATTSLYKGGIRLWNAPRPLQGSAERIRLWIEVATGRELDAGGAFADLDVQTWRERYDRLQNLGGPPAL